MVDPLQATACNVTEANVPIPFEQKQVEGEGEGEDDDNKDVLLEGSGGRAKYMIGGGEFGGRWEATNKYGATE